MVAFRTPVSHRGENVLDIVNKYVCSMIEKSLDLVLYFVTFTGDHSRKVFSYVLEISGAHSD